MKNKHKAATAATAVALSAALLMTGTFAWSDFSQKKTNELGGVLNYDVALIEDFEETSDWSLSNASVNKDVSAVNKGDNAAYVRVNLREYLQLRPYTLSADAYIKDGEGNPVRFAVDADGDYILCASTDKGAFKVGDKYYVQAAGADQTLATMDKTNENGQIGKYMIDPALPDGGKVYDITKVEHYGAAAKATTEDEEMNYMIHQFTDSPSADQAKIAEYVQWKLGPAVKTMAEYTAMSADEKKDAKLWIVDTDGWCYWSQPLAKDEQTSLLLDAATLLKAPKGDLYYAIHTTMQSVSKDDLGWWASDATDDAKGNILPDLNGGEPVEPKIMANGLSLSKTTLRLDDDTPVKLTALITPDEATEKEVTWRTNDSKVAIVDSEGNVTATGKGSATITATTKDGSNLKASCTVNVPSWTPVTSLNISKESLSFAGKNKTANLTASILPANASAKRVIWTSSDPNVATVANNGYVVSVGAGTTDITASSSDGKLSKTCTVTVSAVASTSISMNTPSLLLGPGCSFQPVFGLYPSNTTDTFSLSSPDTSIVTVDEDGLITAVGTAGQTAKIIAKSSNGSVAQAELPVTIIEQKTMSFGHARYLTTPLNWIVLKEEDGKALILSDLPIGQRTAMFTETYAKYKSWTENKVRTFLNDANSGGFLGDYLSAEEQARIVPAEVKTRTAFDSSSVETTTDKVFLLGAGDIPEENYVYTELPDTLVYRQRTPGTYSWGRSPVFDNSRAIAFTDSKTVQMTVNSDMDLRPMMWITMP